MARLFDVLGLTKESQNIEFKTSWRDEYLKIIASFANSEGGKLYIGKDDKGKVIGVENAKKLLEDIPNKIRNKLGLTPSIHLLKEKNKEYLEIEIVPVNFAVSYEGKFYVRSGSTTQELEGQELLNFLLKKSGRTWDELFEERATIEDLNSQTVMEFRTLAKDKIPSIEQDKDWITTLEKLRLVENGKIKKAGILLFGKDPQKFYLQAAIKIGKFKNRTEIISTDIISGNLFEQLQKTIDILRTKYLLSEVRFEGIYRKEVLEYPYEALREAVINALIHRDYSGTSQIQIRVYDDKLIVMNEGRLPPDITPEKLKTEHLSKPRNPLLAATFYYAGYIEAWGRGTLKIIDACRAQGLPEPDFIDDNGTIKVIFHKDIYTEENLRKMGLNERQIKAVMYAKAKGRITNRQYQQIAGCHRNTATQDLLDLVNKGILKRSSKKGKGSYYEIAH